MTEVSIPMTIEEEISELQQNGLLDLSDHSDLPCMPGIQATDVGSLLEQFEEGKEVCLALKAPITTTADDIHKYFFIVFQRK